MVSRTVAEAADAMQGRVVLGDGAERWSGAALDSRRVVGGELFFALPGERADGHAFVPEALSRGAAGAVVADEVKGVERGALIRVTDPYRGLHDLTRALRRQVPGQLVAITGSSGKTTTKDLLTELLASRFRAAGSPGNLNNLYGFPLALLGIPDDTEWMVAEMGMSTPGELAEISRLGRPEAAVFTNVRPVHLETLGSLQAVAEAKAELLAGLAPDGLVVANADDPWVRKIAARHHGRLEWFGTGSRVAYRATAIEEAPEGRPGVRFRLSTPEGEVPIALRLHGRYNVENFLAAAACAHTLGVSLEEIRAVAGALTTAAGRGQVRPTRQGARVIDDSYNSNPVALERALESAAKLPARRHWAVLGDMLELGLGEGAYHREAGRHAARLGFAPVVGVGELCRELVAGAAEAGTETAWFSTAAEATTYAREQLRAGDLVLVKGSRGIGLEQVVGALEPEEGA